MVANRLSGGKAPLILKLGSGCFGEEIVLLLLLRFEQQIFKHIYQLLY